MDLARATTLRGGKMWGEGVGMSVALSGLCLSAWSWLFKPICGSDVLG